MPNAQNYVILTSIEHAFVLAYPSSRQYPLAGIGKWARHPVCPRRPLFRRTVRVLSIEAVSHG